MKLVSVIIPAYNAEKTIEAAVESVLAQTYKNIEIIIVNDGSVDNTGNICDQLTRQDARIKVLSITNAGVSNARNIGLKYAQGSYISFLDSDDGMEENMLEKMVSSMHENNTCLVCCGYNVVNSEQKLLFSQVPQKASGQETECNKIEILQECGCFNALWNKMFIASIIQTNNIRMDISISMGEDLIFVIDYLRHTNGAIHIIPEALYRYRLSNNGLQATYKDKDQLRYKQLNYIKQLYLEKEYQLDGFYNEMLRTIYIDLLENCASYYKIKQILSSDLCSELKEKKISCTGKYKVMYLLIRLGSAHLISYSIHIFRLLKKFSGKSFEWRKDNEF